MVVAEEFVGAVDEINLQKQLRPRCYSETVALLFNTFVSAQVNTGSVNLVDDEQGFVV